MKSFIIQTMPRCGTHMVSSALNTHPYITCFEDIFRKTLKLGPKKEHIPTICENFARLNTKPTWGSWVHANNGRSRRIERFGYPPDQYWQEIEGYFEQCITVIRHNILRATISRGLAKATKDWQVYTQTHQQEAKNKKVFLGVKYIYKILEDYEQSYLLAQQRFAGRNKVFWYEDLVNNWDDNMQQIQDFLQVSYHPVKPLTWKTGHSDLRNTLLNYDEIYEHFKDTKYNQYFHME